MIAEFMFCMSLYFLGFSCLNSNLTVSCMDMNVKLIYAQCEAIQSLPFKCKGCELMDAIECNATYSYQMLNGSFGTYTLNTVEFNPLYEVVLNGRNNINTERCPVSELRIVAEVVFVGTCHIAWICMTMFIYVALRML
jgi:hypothetical protein